MTERVLSETGEELLGRLNPLYVGDPHIQGAVDASARELDRLDADSAEVRDGSWPATASSRMLALWERTFGLTPNPAGLSLDERRSLVGLFFRRLKRDPSGSSWQDRLTELIGSAWTYNEDHPQSIVSLVRQEFDGSWGGWAFDTGTSDKIEHRGGLGVPVDFADCIAYASATAAETDQAGQVQFTAGPDSGSSAAGVVLKRLAGGDLLLCQWDEVNGLRIYKRVSGSYTDLATQAHSVSGGDMRWLRAKVVGNAVTLEAWGADPERMVGSALATVSHTLTGGDATKWGSGVAGSVGFRINSLGPAWSLGHALAYRHIATDEYTVRIVIPYGGGSEAEARVEQLARQITPANLALLVVNSEGFILGESHLGTDAL